MQLFCFNVIVCSGKNNAITFLGFNVTLKYVHYINETVSWWDLVAPYYFLSLYISVETHMHIQLIYQTNLIILRIHGYEWQET